MVIVAAPPLPSAPYIRAESAQGAAATRPEPRSRPPRLLHKPPTAFLQAGLPAPQPLRSKHSCRAAKPPRSHPTPLANRGSLSDDRLGQQIPDSHPAAISLNHPSDTSASPAFHGDSAQTAPPSTWGA